MTMAHQAGAIPPHDSINMDVSDLGVCGVWHTHQFYFAVRWNQDEQERIEKFKARTDTSFNINYRELLGAYFAVVLWSPLWPRVYGRDAHIWLVIDNTSTVSWSDTRSSKHPEDQHALWSFGGRSPLFTSSEHIPGHDNSWADLGSRSWGSKNTIIKFRYVCANYKQVEVPAA
jgi:hypothetical protein